MKLDRRTFLIAGGVSLVGALGCNRYILSNTQKWIKKNEEKGLEGKLKQKKELKADLKKRLPEYKDRKGRDCLFRISGHTKYNHLEKFLNQLTYNQLVYVSYMEQLVRENHIEDAGPYLAVSPFIRRLNDIHGELGLDKVIDFGITKKRISLFDPMGRLVAESGAITNCISKDLGFSLLQITDYGAKGVNNTIFNECGETSEEIWNDYVNLRKIFPKIFSDNGYIAGNLRKLDRNNFRENYVEQAKDEIKRGIWEPSYKIGLALYCIITYKAINKLKEKGVELTDENINYSSDLAYNSGEYFFKDVYQKRSVKIYQESLRWYERRIKRVVDALLKETALANIFGVPFFSDPKLVRAA